MNGSWNFSDQVVMITGGASGLGFAGAEAFAAAGATLVLADIRAEAAQLAVERLGGGPHLAVSGDVAVAADVDMMVNTAREAFGRIDVLVNCAGIPDVFRPTIEQDYEQFRRLVDIHLGGTFLVSKTVAPVMLANGRGAICNISSIAGVLGLTPRNAYSAAKAGISMLTRTLGTEWVSRGVRVNCIAPGYIVTPFFDRLVAEGKLDQHRIIRRTPIGRLGKASELAEAMLFLCSSNASYISGVTLQVDGGYMSWGAPSDAAVDA
ncbi:SDR family NAD(P)-dependent oxidoreductase [Metarhizobium album]|nr:glucose 1-dehydrogenase [Rhizobium album]